MDLRVAICTPVSGGVLTSAYAWSLAELVRCFMAAEQENGTHDCTSIIVDGSILPDQRQRCVIEAMKYDATHILWLDSDMRVPHDAIQVLLRHGLPIVGANYVRTNVPAIPTAYRDDDEFTGPVYTREDSEGLEEVAHCGMGCLLMDIRCFEAIDLPFFDFEAVNDGRRFRGEDVYMMRKMRDAGLRVFIDHTVSRKVSHMGWFGYTNDVGVRNDEARLAALAAKRREEAA